MRGFPDAAGAVPDPDNDEDNGLDCNCGRTAPAPPPALAPSGLDRSDLADMVFR